MNRRKFVSAGFAGILIGISGCLVNIRKNSTSAGNVSESHTDTKKTSDADLRVAGVYADEVDREFIDYEYVLLENDSEDSVDVSGYTIEYQSDYTFQLDDLVLESGAQLVIATRVGKDTTLASSPPVYLQYAGFGTGSGTSVLNESGTVRVRNDQGDIISSVDFESFGCDDGTITSESGDTVNCIHNSI